MLDSDQPTIFRRIADIGAGLCLPRTPQQHPSAAALQEALLQSLNGSRPATTAHWRRLVRRHGGAAAGAALVESYLEDGIDFRLLTADRAALPWYVASGLDVDVILAVAVLLMVYCFWRLLRWCCGRGRLGRRETKDKRL
eukprot:NODE_8277_length_525_cov_4.594538_g7221_i0.p1 GENE.NODE_8277_length_525_cov_4.594538_g7221_i0~~NODE_8277_length_525_cov_4.594538_g7221_i0.p1  ORF type:complete len:164 (+),score=33.26 NODE_8277_length_525_cov_4.594538_g7221_i0:73-492(+)